MLIVDCIEEMESVFDFNFKDQSLKRFSKMKGETILLTSTRNLQVYALYSNGKFYLNTIEELKDSTLKFKVFEFVQFSSLISMIDTMVHWNKDFLMPKLLSAFQILH